MKTKTIAPRRDLYETVTNKIIAELEAGIFPWARPWKAGGNVGITMPTNGATGRRYSGVNVLLLWSAADEAGYSDARWMTFKQASDLGANVRKGEKGTLIVYSDRFVSAAEKARAAAAGDDERSAWFLKSFCVFNVAQIDNLPDRLATSGATVERDTSHQIAEAEDFIRHTGADFRNGGDSAFYSPAADFVQLPYQSSYFEPVNYYRTAFHELSHWTGHKSRLDRAILNQFGTKDYAREELVAELGAAFTCASLGIAPTVRHADYIGNWLEVLKNDKRAIFRAASLAGKASDYLHGLQPVQMEEAA